MKDPALTMADVKLIRESGNVASMRARFVQEGKKIIQVKDNRPNHSVNISSVPFQRKNDKTTANHPVINELRSKFQNGERSPELQRSRSPKTTSCATPRSPPDSPTPLRVVDLRDKLEKLSRSPGRGMSPVGSPLEDKSRFNRGDFNSFPKSAVKKGGKAVAVTHSGDSPELSLQVMRARLKPVGRPDMRAEDQKKDEEDVGSLPMSNKLISNSYENGSTGYYTGRSAASGDVEKTKWRLRKIPVSVLDLSPPVKPLRPACVILPVNVVMRCQGHSSVPCPPHDLPSPAHLQDLARQMRCTNAVLPNLSKLHSSVNKCRQVSDGEVEVGSEAPEPPPLSSLPKCPPVLRVEDTSSDATVQCTESGPDVYNPEKPPSECSSTGSSQKEDYGLGNGKRDKNDTDKDKRKKIKEQEKLKKMFKLTGNEVTLECGMIKKSCKGGRLELSVQEGEWIQIIRMENNPSGKWLARDGNGRIGYVDLRNININPDSIKTVMISSNAVGNMNRHESSSSSIAEAPLPEDEEPEEEEGIYEEVETQ